MHNIEIDRKGEKEAFHLWRNTGKKRDGISLGKSTIVIASAVSLESNTAKIRSKLEFEKPTIISYVILKAFKNG